MTMLSTSIRAKALEHKELVEQWGKKELVGKAAKSAGIQRPETRTTERVMEDVQYTGIVTRGVGKEFHERTAIAKKDVDRFALIYSMSKQKFQADIKNRLIPIMRRGYAWESPQSRRLREQYMTKADKIFTMFDNCDINAEFFSEGAAIEIHSVSSKSMEDLEFCSAAGIVDKKPRKRKNDTSGDAVFFQELTQRGERAIMFGVFDGLVEGRGSESEASALAIKILKEYVEKIRDTRSHEDIQALLTQYANEADSTISETMNNLGGTTASIGVVSGKQMTYLNIGDSRIYAVSLAGIPVVKKITTDDGIAGAVERGACIPLQEFVREAAFPYLYLGSFSQQINGRYAGKKVLHQGFTLRAPNIGTINISDYDMILGVTDGVWKHLPMKVEEKGFLVDANCELTASELIRGFKSKKPKDMVESLHEYARSNMNAGIVKVKNNYSVVSSPEDIGIVAVSV
ncbi:MAG: PP2C family serine/threonine-protein phosphatase [Candidatus Micrarchaeia archaeon]